jgi:PKD repeat protein
MPSSLFNDRYKYSLICFITGLIISNSLNAQVQANFRADKTGGCSPLSVNFTNTSTGNINGASYRWDFGNGNISTLPNPSAIFIHEQPYTVTLTVTQGTQTSTRTMQVEVYKKPTADFISNVVKGCSPVDVRFSANAQPGSGYVSSYFWDYGDGLTGQTSSSGINHIYNNVQPATVSLTVKNNYGCHATVVKNDLITVLPSISADFAADKQFLCNISDPIQLTNKSKAQVPLTYSWDFGDGQTATTENPSYTFNKKGTYTVKLTVANSDGCTVSKTLTNYLNVANFSTDLQVPAVICRDANTKVTAICSPNPTRIDWDIDGNVYNNYWTKEFNTTFYTGGTHNVKFTANYGTCQQVVTRSFTVNDPPNMNGFIIDIKDICGPPARVELKDTSTDAVAWEWDVDVNNYASNKDATTKNASTVYSGNTGTYVGLRTYTAAGCTKQVIKPISINAPSASIYCTTPGYQYRNIVACGVPVTLSFKASPYQTNIVSYKWIFDNNVVSTDPEPTHTFAGLGRHQVKLEFVTDKGCNGTAWFTNEIDIRETYKGSFTSLSGNVICGNNSVVFEAKSNAPGPVTQEWFMNDLYRGTTASNTFTTSFDDIGKYTVKLITNNNGCRDTFTRVDYITVLGPFPRISGVTTSCTAREEVTFGHASRYAEKWEWDFGDGQTATYNTDERVVKHSYSATGKYNVKLTVTKDQCRVSTSVFAYVYLKPSPLLSAPKMQVCPNEQFDFNLTNLPRQPNESYSFDFYFTKIEYGDGTAFNGTITPWYNNLDIIQHNGKLGNLEAGKSGLRMILRESATGCYDTTNTIPMVVSGNKAGFRILRFSLRIHLK